MALAALVAIGALAACDSDSPTTPIDSIAAGATIFGVDDQNRLIAFGRQNPTANMARVVDISGLPAGEAIVGIDFRANGATPGERLLYALSSGSRIYVIDTTSGVATVLGNAAFTPGVSGASFGFDFNPQADRLRVHTDADQDLRLNQLTGGLAAVDGVLAYQTGDVNAGQNPTIVGTAYTNSVSGAASTELFAIDADRDALVFLASPNNGVITTRGPLNVNTTSAVGFDIVGSGIGTAYATLTPNGESKSRLYTINLTTGAATQIGEVNYSRPLIGITVVP